MSDSQHKSPASRWPARLRQAIMAYFDETDIQILCFDLGIDYDNLPGDSKPVRIVQLIEYLARSGKIPELIDQCSQYRPNVPWDELRAAAIQHPLVFEYGKANQVTQIPPQVPQHEPTTTPPQVGHLARFTQPRLVMVAAIGLIVIALIVGTLSCPVTAPTDEETFDTLISREERAVERSDVDPEWSMVQVKDIFDPAAEFHDVGSGDPPTRGPTAHYERVFREYRYCDIRYDWGSKEVDWIEPGAEAAVSIVTYGSWGSKEEEGCPHSIPGDHVQWHFRKDANGSWRITKFVYNNYP
jgi:hypothetical protein